jgi:protein-S-isoprenylcysteine O-methyltransferase Ste14
MGRFFDWFIIGAQGFFILLVLGRMLFWRRRGVKVVGTYQPVNLLRKIEDTVGGLLPPLRIYETFAYAWPFGFHLWPSVFGKEIVSAEPLKFLGCALWLVALGIYLAALKAFGASWRLRVGSADAAPLVTNGIFGLSRNPIYVSFVCMGFGTFLILGQLIFLLIALAGLPLLHRRILREEEFLQTTQGETYREYRRRVGRYCKRF